MGALLSRLTKLHAATLRCFPLLVAEFYLCIVSVWLDANNECSVDDTARFQSTWSILITAAVLCGVAAELAATSAAAAAPTTNPMSLGRRAVSVAAHGVAAGLFFVAFSFLRAGPFQCINPVLDDQVGPALLGGLYALGIVLFWIASRCRPSVAVIVTTPGDDDNDDTEVDEEAKASTRQRPKTPPAPQLVGRHGGLDGPDDGRRPSASQLVYAAAIQMRNKAPVAAILIHYLVVSTLIHDGLCDPTAMVSPESSRVLFYIYLACLHALVFGHAFYVAYRARFGASGGRAPARRLHNVSPRERTVYALLVGLETTTLLFAVVMLRAKPLACFGGNSTLALAYATAVPLLILMQLLAAGTSYLMVRNYSLQNVYALTAPPPQLR